MSAAKKTSALAAAAQKPLKVGSTRDAIVLLLREHGPQTDDQLVERYAALQTRATDIPRVTPLSIRTRRHELTTAGRIRDHGRGTSSLGFPATVWALAED